MQAVNNYQSLITRWLTGANSGDCGSLYVTSRGKGTSLFICGVQLYHSYNPSKRRRRVADIRLAIMQNNQVRILTAYDTFDILGTAKRLGLDVVENEPSHFKADGTIKNGIIQVR